MVWFAEPPRSAVAGGSRRRAISQLRMLAPAIGTAPSSGVPASSACRSGCGPIPLCPTGGTDSATASVPGLSVTATATATQIVQEHGRRALRDVRQPQNPCMTPSYGNTDSKTCGYRYLVKSPPGGYTITATTTWQITWSGGGASRWEDADPAVDDNREHQRATGGDFLTVTANGARAAPIAGPAPIPVPKTAAQRRWRPGLVALAVALVATGGLSATYAITLVGSTTSYLAVNKKISAGAQITPRSGNRADQR